MQQQREYSDRQLVEWPSAQLYLLTPELKRRRYNLKQTKAFNPELNYRQTVAYLSVYRPESLERLRESNRRSAERARAARPPAEPRVFTLPTPPTVYDAEQLALPGRYLAKVLDRECGEGVCHHVDHIIGRNTPKLWLPAEYRELDVEHESNLRVIPERLNIRKFNYTNAEFLRDTARFECTYETCCCGDRAALFPPEVVQGVRALYDAEYAIWTQERLNYYRRAA